MRLACRERVTDSLSIRQVDAIVVRLTLRYLEQPATHGIKSEIHPNIAEAD